jgi:hypothetical protein
MLDTLGAEVRYKEYGLVLHHKLKEISMEDWSDRIPVSLEKLISKEFNYIDIDYVDNLTEFELNIYSFGLKALLNHVSKLPDFDPPPVFLQLCVHGHFELAFEFDHDYHIRSDLSVND